MDDGPLNGDRTVADVSLAPVSVPLEHRPTGSPAAVAPEHPFHIGSMACYGKSDTGTVLLGIGIASALRPYEVAGFEERLDAIGSTRSRSEVELGDWKVLLTRLGGIAVSLFGVLVLFDIRSGRTRGELETRRRSSTRFTATYSRPQFATLCEIAIDRFPRNQ